METLTPQVVREPQITNGADGNAIDGHPLVRGIIGVGVNLASDFGREVLASELTQQRQPALTQQELPRNAEELLYLQSEADLLKAQSSGRIIRSFFGTAEEIRKDIEKMSNYSGLLPTCERRGNQLKYSDDARRRTASPARRKSTPQSVGCGTAAVARAIGPGAGPDQGARRPLGQR